MRPKEMNLPVVGTPSLGSNRMTKLKWNRQDFGTASEGFHWKEAGTSADDYRHCSARH